MLCRKRNGQPPRGNNRSASRQGFSLVELIVVMVIIAMLAGIVMLNTCLLYTSPSPRDRTRSRMPSSA